MNRVIWFCLFLLFVVPASGQHRGGFAAGLGRGGVVSGGFGRGRFRGGVVIGRFNRSGFSRRFSRFWGLYPDAYPLFDGGYDYGYPLRPTSSSFSNRPRR